MSRLHSPPRARRHRPRRPAPRAPRRGARRGRGSEPAAADGGQVPRVPHTTHVCNARAEAAASASRNSWSFNGSWLAPADRGGGAGRRVLNRGLAFAGLSPGGPGRWRRSVWCRGGESVGDCGGFASIGHVELAQDVGDVDACGLVADEQGVGDFRVGVAASDETEDVDFRGSGQRVRPARRLVGRCGSGPATIEPSRWRAARPLPQWFGPDPGGNGVCGPQRDAAAVRGDSW